MKKIFLILACVSSLTGCHERISYAKGYEVKGPGSERAIYTGDGELVAVQRQCEECGKAPNP